MEVKTATYSLCKILSFRQKLKLKKQNKTREKRCYDHITVFLGKNPLEKHQIFDKLDDFENRPSGKMFSVGHKLKKKKKDAKNHSTIILELFCAKKPLEETPNIREMR